MVRRVLFTRHNSYPQKKVLTFPKHRKDFGVRVNYGDVAFLDDAQQRMLGEKALFTVNLNGVDKAIEKHDGDNVETKGRWEIIFSDRRTDARCYRNRGKNLVEFVSEA